MKARRNYAPVIPVAPVDPVTAIVTIGVLAFGFLSHIGAGREEANTLTDPGGEQWLVGQVLAQIMDEYEKVKASGAALTLGFIDDTIAYLEKILDQFCADMKRFPRAGPGACETITRVVGKLIDDRKQERAQLLASQQGEPMDYPVYRLILQTAPGRVDTGATYPGCNHENSNACDPRQFATVDQAFDFAFAHGELPHICASADEAWFLADAEERARQAQAQYTGPSVSPRPTPSTAGPGTQAQTAGAFDLASALPVIAIAAVGYMLIRKRG